MPRILNYTTLSRTIDEMHDHRVGGDDTHPRGGEGVQILDPNRVLKILGVCRGEARCGRGSSRTLAGVKGVGGVPKANKEGKGKGKVLGRSPNSSVSVIPTCPKAQHATSYYTHQNSCNSGTVNSRET